MIKIQEWKLNNTSDRWKAKLLTQTGYLTLENDLFVTEMKEGPGLPAESHMS